MAFGRGRGGPRGRGGFRGARRGNGYNFKNFGGSNFEPCNLRDIFKENNNVNDESFEENGKHEEKPRLNGNEPRVNGNNKYTKFENEEETSEKVKKYKKDKVKIKNQDVEEAYNNGYDQANNHNGTQYDEKEEYPYENGRSQISFQTEEEDCPFPKLNDEAKQYFKRVFEQLKGTFESAEDEEIFYNNVLEETVGQEGFLSTTKLGSRCLELVFVKCKNSKLVRRFLEAFSTDLYTICVDLGATHVTQGLLVCCLHLIQNKEEYKVSEEDSSYFEEWVVKIAEFCIENLEDFIFNETNSTYVIRTLLSVLSGKSVESSIIRRVDPKKKISELENHDSQMYNYDNTPSSFVSLFKKLAKKLIKNEKLVEIVKSEISGPIIQVLLIVSAVNFPKLCQKMIKKIAKKTFSKEETELISSVFQHQYATYIVERVVEAANVETMNWLWERYFDEQFKELCLHDKGNFIAQKIIKMCKTKEEFEKIYEIAEPLMDEIFNRGYCGLLAKLAEACKKLDTCQAKLIKALMSVFRCNEPLERQEEITPLLLNLQRYDDYHSKKGEPVLKVTLSGSLLVQYTLWFHKPHKILMSLLNMSPELLVQLAQDITGCHVYDAFLKSTFVGEKKRDALINKLKPHLLELACHKFGSRCIDSMWSAASIKIKSVIAEELCKNESTLKSDRFGRYVHRNLALHNFKTRKDEWKQLQNVNTKKRKMFDDIIGDLDQSSVKMKKE